MNAFDSFSPSSCREHSLPPGLPGRWILCDRAKVRQTDHTIVINGGFYRNAASHGDGEVRFHVRAPGDAPEVQLWMGFRAQDRHSRYAVALRGGNNNHLYLSRLAPEGGARFLGIAPLEFSPRAREWYHLRILLSQRRIQVFLGQEAAPRIDVEDDASGWCEGGIVLGGGYLPAEFSRVEFTPLSELAPLPASSPKSPTPEPERGYRHAHYAPLPISLLDSVRQEVSLDGCWLFHPEVPENPIVGAREKECDEENWHTIDVPNLWTPSLAWLHGETIFSELDGVSTSKGVNDKVWLEEMARVSGYGFDWKTTQQGWYRQHLVLPEDISGRHFELIFGAVAKACEIWVNGELAGTHIGMFGEIRCDITALLTSGENTIAVKVIRNPDNLSLKDSRIVGIAESVAVTADMTQSLPRDMMCHDPAGIWQPVTLLVTSPIRVQDVFVQPSLDTARICLEVKSPPEAEASPLCVGYTIRCAETGDVLIADEEVISGTPSSLEQASFDLPPVTPRHWHPETPHLYELEVRLSCQGILVDRHVTQFGFRTFETCGNQFLLNGKPYWLRGANHFPHGLRPNDRELARRFIQVAREGNVRVTRSHVAPFTKAWVEETDRQGMLVSFEGIWPWLMLSGDLPAPALLESWREDFLSLIRRYRNHPSIVLWTINNEMKFYIFDQDDKALLARKWEVVSKMIGEVRKFDPSRPVVADSGYVRMQHRADYEGIVRERGFDDGDVDDVHQYYSWYHPSFTTTYRGEIAEGIASEDRPFISQELSSGYCRNDDGLPVRFYLFKHGTPLSLVGQYAYEHNDPAYYLERIGFITKETVEAIRRSTRDQTAGLLSFAYLTWFRDVHDISLKPWPVYYALKDALQPILVSLELAGRHFFSGDSLCVNAVVINDASDASPIVGSTLQWEICNRSGALLSSGEKTLPIIEFYTNHTCPLDIELPDQVHGRCEAVLRVRLFQQGKELSTNCYDILVADREWSMRASLPTDLGKSGSWDVLKGVCLCPNETPYLIVRGRQIESEEDIGKLRAYVEDGGRLLLLNSGEWLPKMLPGIVKSYRPVRGEIVNMVLPESPVFDGLHSRDLAWLHSQKPSPALVCEGVFQVDRDQPGVSILAEFCDYHNYLQQPEDITEYCGSPLWQCDLGMGFLLVSEIVESALAHDPVAVRLYANLCTFIATSIETEEAQKSTPAESRFSNLATR